MATATTQKPRIGISGARQAEASGVASSKSVEAMAALVRKAGGEPVIIDHLNPEPIESFDGIMLMGNDYDIDPARYGEKSHPENKVETQRHGRRWGDFSFAKARAEYEWGVIKEAKAKHIPLFGVCGGMQRINVGLGGKLVQHLDGLDASKNNAAVDTAEAVKTISMLTGTHLMHLSERGQLLSPAHTNEKGEFKTLGINSFHHQVVDPLHIGEGLRVAAVSQEPNRMLIEAIEAIDPKWYITGVQWHPEFMPNNALSVKMIERFVEHAQDRQASKPVSGRFVAMLAQQPAAGIGVPS